LDRGGRREGLAVLVVDELRVNVTQCAVDAQARTLCRAFYLLAQAQMAAHSHVI
jgi:hypothetical protein